MPESSPVSKKHALILAAVLCCQLALSYTVGGEKVPLVRPLSEFPSVVAQWRMIREGILDAGVRNILHTDDINYFMHPGRTVRQPLASLTFSITARAGAAARLKTACPDPS